LLGPSEEAGGVLVALLGEEERSRAGGRPREGEATEPVTTPAPCTSQAGQWAGRLQAAVWPQEDKPPRNGFVGNWWPVSARY